MRRTRRLVLLRHGACHSLHVSGDEVVPDDDDNGLTDEGRAAVARLASSFPAGASTRILASPLRRAAETAAIVAERLGVGVDIDARLAERRVTWLGRATVDQSRAWQAESHLAPARRVRGDEAVVEHFARVASVLADEVLGREEELVIVVSHGGTLDCAQAWLHGVDVGQGPALFTRCAPAHFHLWDFFDVDGHAVRCLSGVDLPAWIE